MKSRIALLLSLGLAAACGDSTTSIDTEASSGSEGSTGDDPGYVVLDPADAPQGLEPEEWAASWWSWAMRLPATGHPLLSTSETCRGVQDGPVYFLGSFAGLVGGSGPDPVMHRCTIPEGALVLVPIVNITLDDDTAPTARNQRDAELEAAASAFVDDMDLVVLEIDGETLAGSALEDLRVGPYRASYRLASSDSVPAFLGHPPAHDDVDPTFGDGVYAMVKLSAGSHTITTAALDVHDPDDPGDDFAAVTTYTILVE